MSSSNFHGEWEKQYVELDEQFGPSLEQSVVQIANLVVDSVNAADQIAPTVSKMTGIDVDLIPLFHVITIDRDKAYPESTRHLIAHANHLECYLLTRVIRQVEGLMPEFSAQERLTACLLFGMRLVHETIALLDQLPYHNFDEDPEKELIKAKEEAISMRSKYTQEKVSQLPDHIRIPFEEFLNQVDESIDLS